MVKLTLRSRKINQLPFIVSIGTKRGDFCYGLDGSIGTVDDNMSDVPVNVECDPRVACSQSTNTALCYRDFPSMAKIMVRIAIKFSI